MPIATSHLPTRHQSGWLASVHSAMAKLYHIAADHRWSHAGLTQCLAAPDTCVSTELGLVVVLIFWPTMIDSSNRIRVIGSKQL